MSILNDVSKKIVQVSHTTIQKTKDMADVSQLKREITNIDKNIHKLFDMLGQQYYMTYGTCPAPEVAEICRQIQELCLQMNDLHEELISIKSIVYCPNCGQKIVDDSVFCTNCGNRIKED